MSKTKQLNYQVTKDAVFADGNAERGQAIAIDENGKLYMAIFTGPQAAARAQQYANWINQPGNQSKA
jgi:hypothetical protein